jgi:hypothetical protein
MFGTTGTTTGFQFGADAFAGLALGASCDFMGTTSNGNLGLGPFSITFMKNVTTDEFAGFSVGMGPSFPPVSFS